MSYSVCMYSPAHGLINLQPPLQWSKMVAHTFVVSGEGEISSQCVIDKLVGLAFGGDNVVEFWQACQLVGLWHGGGSGLHTIPELLLIV